MHLLHAADCRYVGQGYELRVPMPEGRLSAEGIHQLREAFNRLHREEYGHAFPDNPIELVNVRVVATGRLPRMPEVPAPTGGGLASALVDRAGVHFAHNGRLEAHPTALYERMQLPVGTRLEGPAVLLQADSTVVVPPAATAEVLPSGDLLILV